jgi:predicted TIM-barrel fold metal-dependent hydrolase
MGTPNEYRSRGSMALLQSKSKWATVLCSPDFIGNSNGIFGQTVAANMLKESLMSFESGLCSGFGELGLAHYDKWSKNIEQGAKKQHVVLVDLQLELLQELFKFSNKNKTAIVFHIEPYYTPKKIDRSGEVYDFYASNCKKYPQVKIIAAHNSMLLPEKLEDLFLECPNLYVDIKFTHQFNYWSFYDLNPPTKKDGSWHEKWLAIAIKYSDRIMLSTDWHIGYPNSHPLANLGNYKIHIKDIRSILGVLPHDAQDNIAYKNAIKIFGIPTSGEQKF